MTTIFEKIVVGQIPCTKIYEDEKTFAFLDINPAQFGHILVISKQPYPDLFSIPDDVLAAVSISAKKVATALKKAVGADGINQVQNNGKAAGQEVFHYHVHLIPRRNNDDYTVPYEPKKYGEGEAAALGEKIRQQLN